MHCSLCIGSEWQPVKYLKLVTLNLTNNKALQYAIMKERNGSFAFYRLLNKIIFWNKMNKGKCCGHRHEHLGNRIV